MSFFIKGIKNQQHFLIDRLNKILKGVVHKRRTQSRGEGLSIAYISWTRRVFQMRTSERLLYKTYEFCGQRVRVNFLRSFMVGPKAFQRLSNPKFFQMVLSCGSQEINWSWWNLLICFVVQRFLF